MKHINLRKLEVFVAVMNARSVTRAAESLNITQPAVSRSLKELEQEFGFELFYRSRGAIQPSNDALLLASEVERLFEQTRSLREATERVRAARAGKLSIAAIPSLAGSVIGTAVGAFMSKRPNVGVKLYSPPSPDIVEDVLRHRVDLGFIHGPADEDDVEQWVVGESEIVCVMRREHPLAGHTTLSADALEGQPLVFLDAQAPPSHLIREAFAAAGRRPRVVAEASLSVAARAVASSSANIALIDPLTLLDEGDELVATPFRPLVPVRIYCICSARRPLSRAARFLADEVESQILSYADRYSYIRGRAAD